MLAVAADLTTVERFAASCDGVVIANHNAPAQAVLSGDVAAIDSLERALAAAKIDARRIPVSTAFHSPLVAGACGPFRAFLDGVQLSSPRIPVFSNVTATPYPDAPAAIRDQLASAIAARVRFAEQLEAMYAAGARVFLEVGPSSVLTRLVGRGLGDRPHTSVALDSPDKHGVTSLWDALGRLAAAGIAIDFARYWRDEPAEPDEHTTPSSGFRVRVSGVNYGKPAPPHTPPPAALPAAPLPPPVPALAPSLSAVPAAPRSPLPAAAPSPLATIPPAIAESLIHAQMEYQRLMAESHIAFLRAFEAAHVSSGAALASVMNIGEAIVPPHSPSPYSPSPASPSPYALSPHAPSPSQHSPSQHSPSSHSRSSHSPSQASPPPHSVAPQPPSPTVSPRSPDLEALLLAVVAEKTGYPAEMIDTTMDLEADLGIDSIKRVEILSTIRERAPGLPEVEPAQMATLRTLRAIVAFLRGGATGPTSTKTRGGPPSADGVVERGQALAVGSERIAASPQVAGATRLLPGVVAAPPAGLAMPGLVGERIVVTDDGGGVAQALVARLRGRGLDARAMDAVPEDAGAVVFLGGLRAIASVEDAMAVHRAALDTARAVATRFQARGGTFVTVEDIGGDFGLSGSAGDRAWLGGVGALAKTAAREWPRAAVRAIDIARGGRTAEAIAESLVEELFGGGTELEVGLAA
ncbi:MAG: acyltransferase domain-containing protein, partial [bacterium]